jgi:hypothetical protein
LPPELPPNIKLGQIRCTIGLLAPEEWRRLDEDGRAAVDALSLHVWWRARQDEHEAFEGEEDDCVFLTVPWMQGLLRAVGARKTGEKTAAAAIAFLKQRGLIVDTGKTKKPRRSSERVAKAEKFQAAGPVAREGGKDAQPTSLRSYWWRVFRVPALTRARRPFLQAPTGSCPTARSTQRLCPHSFAVKVRFRSLGAAPARIRAPSSGSSHSRGLHERALLIK